MSFYSINSAAPNAIDPSIVQGQAQSLTNQSPSDQSSVQGQSTGEQSPLTGRPSTAAPRRVSFQQLLQQLQQPADTANALATATNHQTRPVAESLAPTISLSTAAATDPASTLASTDQTNPIILPAEIQSLAQNRVSKIATENSVVLSSTLVSNSAPEGRSKLGVEPSIRLLDGQRSNLDSTSASSTVSSSTPAPSLQGRTVAIDSANLAPIQRNRPLIEPATGRRHPSQNPPSLSADAAAVIAASAKLANDPDDVRDADVGQSASAITNSVPAPLSPPPQVVQSVGGNSKTETALVKNQPTATLGSVLSQVATPVVSQATTGSVNVDTRETLELTQQRVSPSSSSQPAGIQTDISYNANHFADDVIQVQQAFDSPTRGFVNPADAELLDADNAAVTPLVGFDRSAVSPVLVQPIAPRSIVPTVDINSSNPLPIELNESQVGLGVPAENPPSGPSLASSHSSSTPSLISVPSPSSTPAAQPTTSLPVVSAADESQIGSGPIIERELPTQPNAGPIANPVPDQTATPAAIPFVNASFTSPQTIATAAASVFSPGGRVESRQSNRLNGSQESTALNGAGATSPIAVSPTDFSTSFDVEQIPVLRSINRPESIPTDLAQDQISNSTVAETVDGAVSGDALSAAEPSANLDREPIPVLRSINQPTSPQPNLQAEVQPSGLPPAGDLAPQDSNGFQSSIPIAVSAPSLSNQFASANSATPAVDAAPFSIDSAFTTSSSPANQVRLTLETQLRPLAEEPSQTLRIDLNPVELGRLQIRVEQSGDQLVAQIIASEAASSELLQQERSQLLQSLDDLGLGDASLDISQGQTDQQRSDDHERSSSQSPARESTTDPAPIAAAVSNPTSGVNFVA